MRFLESGRTALSLLGALSRTSFLRSGDFGRARGATTFRREIRRSCGWSGMSIAGVAIAFSLSMGGTSVSGQPAAVLPGPGSAPQPIQATRPGPAGDTAAASPGVLTQMGFVVAIAHAAGAAEACDLPVATRLRLCVQHLLPYWPDFTGQPVPTKADTSALAAIWKHGFIAAYTLQKNPNPPESCASLSEKISELPMWKRCDAGSMLSDTSAVGGEAPVRRGVPDGTGFGATARANREP